MQKGFCSIVFGLVLAACMNAAYLSKAQAYSTLKSFRYNKKKDRSEYVVIPFGKVCLPGKWKQLHYDKQTRQQWFTRKEDSLDIAILFAPCDRFEFNYDGSKTGFEFAKAYYDWEADYYTKVGRLNAVLVEEDSVKGYRIMHLYGQNEHMSTDSYFLYSAANCAARNFYLYGPKFQEAEKLAFLRALLEE